MSWLPEKSRAGALQPLAQGAEVSRLNPLASVWPLR